ncbi:MAG: AmmeMemoRadiSam system radical SAM enzyme [Lentisphaerae bacterium]|nr:AmmeMemoRadiSam system radical SAM enzyme [Lentisphaerota bacterium]
MRPIANQRDIPLADLLDRRTVAGTLYETLPDGSVRCFACAHRCTILPGKRGVCKVRFNDAGTLRVPFGYAAGVQSDPVEKKPFFHAMPGSHALTFGMLGCDLHCSYCQNWVTSQALRDKAAGAPPADVSPDDLVRAAQRTGARLVVSSYNEPLITAEWGRAVFVKAKAAGLVTGFVSNGNATPEVLDYLRPVTDCYKIDLKTMRDENYRQLGARLEHVLESIRGVHARGFWLEVLTLVIPGFNDSISELRDIAQFLAGISPAIPWHVTAFHKDYLMTDPRDTTAGDVVRAAEIGAAAGLHYVYAGNRPGAVGTWENTYCPACRTLLIERMGYVILQYRLTDAGTCPTCDRAIPGRWPPSAKSVRIGSTSDLYGRGPRAVRV